MICNKCVHTIYGQSFTTTKCKKCNKPIVTGHIPGHVLCKECAVEDYCEQCGEVINKRIELFTTITGSYNYNLMNENSDIDKKTYVLPTIDDLYNQKSICKCSTSNTLDTEISDIRRLIHQFKKGSVNSIETLFSDGLTINKELNEPTLKLLMDIINNKDNIARINLKGLFNSSYGIANNYLKGVDYDYSGKKICQGIRCLSLIKRFADNNFQDFKSAIYYEDNDPFRETLLNIKNNKKNINDIKQLALEMSNIIEKKYKAMYIQASDNLSIKLDKITKEMIKINL